MLAAPARAANNRRDKSGEAPWCLTTSTRRGLAPNARRNDSIAVNGFLRSSVLPASNAHSTTKALSGSPKRARAAPRSISGGGTIGNGMRWTGTGETAAIEVNSKRELVHISSTSANEPSQSGRKAASSQAQTAMV